MKTRNSRSPDSPGQIRNPSAKESILILQDESAERTG